MIISTQHIDLLNTHVSECDAEIKTIAAKVKLQKRQDLFCNTAADTKKIISLMIEMSDSQTAIFYAIRNTTLLSAAA
jgi:hypothetical protein